MEPKTILVTGANRGIGLAIVKQLARELPKSTILLGSRTLEHGQKEAESLSENVKAVSMDLSKRSTLEADIERLKKTYPYIDGLINNAGVLFEDTLLDIKPQLLEDVFHVNVFAPFMLTQALLPNMIEHKYGRIVNVSSGWGAFSGGLTGPFSYSMSKAALNALTLTSSQSLPDNVKINSMCPGWVRTRMGGDEATRSPEQGADTAVWLATLDKNGPTGGFFRDRKKIDW